VSAQVAYRQGGPLGAADQRAHTGGPRAVTTADIRRSATGTSRRATAAGPASAAPRIYRTERMRTA
jgi:hypothetical protein